MNNSELSYKLKYILKELGLNKKELLERCRMYNPSLSKPTLLNAINGRNKNTPSIDTLSAIINVCKTSGNPKLQFISFDYLLNDSIQEVNASNVSVYQEIGLSDDVIDRLKQYNTPLIYEYMDTVNYFLYHTTAKYWKYFAMLKRTYDIKNNINDKKEILKLFDEGWYLLYLEENFKNIYDMYIDLKNSKEIDLDKLNNLLHIVIINLKYELNKDIEKTYESMEGFDNNENN